MGKKKKEQTIIDKLFEEERRLGLGHLISAPKKQKRKKERKIEVGFRANSNENKVSTWGVFITSSTSSSVSAASPDTQRGRKGENFGLFRRGDA